MTRPDLLQPYGQYLIAVFTARRLTDRQGLPAREEAVMGMVRRRTRRRTLLVAGGAAVAAGAAGRRARQGGEPQDEQDEQDYDAPPPAPPPSAAAAPAADDATSELERLASLHESGVLSDDEFTAAKAKVLGT